MRSMCSHAFWAIYFLGFYMFKIPLFPKPFYIELFKWSDAISLPCRHDGQEKYQSSSENILLIEYVAFDVFACVLGTRDILYFPGAFFLSSLNGPMRFSHPVDTTDR